MAGARHSNIFKQLIIEAGQQVRINVVGFECVGILG
jgi:hypothetical protein